MACADANYTGKLGCYLTTSRPDVFLGNSEYGVEVQEIDFAKYAEACGGLGFTVREPNEIAPMVFPWFATARNGITIFTHIVFGAVAAWVYKAFVRTY